MTHWKALSAIRLSLSLRAWILSYSSSYAFLRPSGSLLRRDRIFFSRLKPRSWSICRDAHWNLRERRGGVVNHQKRGGKRAGLVLFSLPVYDPERGSRCFF